jgi:hypothetical protein
MFKLWEEQQRFKTTLLFCQDQNIPSNRPVQILNSIVLTIVAKLSLTDLMSTLQKNEFSDSSAVAKQLEKLEQRQQMEGLGTLPAPLPTTTTERLTREAAYEKTKKVLSKSWDQFTKVPRIVAIANICIRSFATKRLYTFLLWLLVKICSRLLKQWWMISNLKQTWK